MLINYPPYVPLNFMKNSSKWMPWLRKEINIIDAAIIEGNCHHILGSKNSSKTAEEDYWAKFDLWNKRFWVKYAKTEPLTKKDQKIPKKEIIQNRKTGEMISKNIIGGERNFWQRIKYSDTSLKIDYIFKCEEFKDKNFPQVKEGINKIKVYSLTELTRLEEIMGGRLELVETGNPETHLWAPNLISLKAIAQDIGADALFCYQEKTGIATPVKYK